MNLKQFDEIYKNAFNNEQINIKCDCCNKTEARKRHSARKNIKRNGMFRCRSCCYTEEGRQRISEATSYTRSDETKQKMSVAKKEFYQSKEGIELKNKLSILTAYKNSNNELHNYRRDWYPSSKNDKYVYYCSSYELRLCWLLDKDDSVESYQTQISYEIENRGRCLDCLVNYKDGKKLAIEVKPQDRLEETINKDQLEDSAKNAVINGWDFKVYTEKEFGMTYAEIRKWADELIKEITGIDYVDFRMGKNRERAKKHYDSVISQDKVEVYCDYCKETHSVLRVNYDKNIKKHGEYWCERKGGHEAGKKPKKKKANPYAAEGKKQCNACKEVKLFVEYTPDKTKSDGYSTRCKACRAKINKEKYNEKKNDEKR